MKLVDKLSLWFIGIVVLLTPVTACICYYNLEKKIDEAEITHLTEMNDMAAASLAAGQWPDRQTEGLVTVVSPLTGSLPEQRLNITKTDLHNGNSMGMLSLLTVNSYVSVGNVNYRISSSNYVPSGRQIRAAIMDSIVWKLLLIILCVCVTARLVSQKILSSLRQTIKTIQHFNVKEKVQFPVSRTREFKELNSFLQKMTDKTVDEYAAVKEFSENASHELQTPLAVLRNKLELLSETNIEEGQAELIGDMHNAIEKLSRINRSLVLLTKLENNEYSVTEKIRFCKITKDILAAYEDRIGMKHLTVTTDIDGSIDLKIHPALADMLVNNLLGNAIRHNVENGKIELILTHRRLVVRNTGLPPEMPTEELFQRFKKSNQSSESVGLGLAIVKQICEVCGFSISYNYKNQLHVIQIEFVPVLQNEAAITAHDNVAAAVLA
ncbi:HAMP domain-containing sensor histidine kinase [uncultured Chitinophaga sp.]|jgi:Signal transduction histidine kinase|uniref:sensor histidine kinase n=1 Tax=uncultured Chitinophaga sp. TaxID=339340 RepID=UPI00261628DA|nr:HAMP domain-containing sensor histidine kinase [uncultured Chitinophaga sp.]